MLNKIEADAKKINDLELDLDDQRKSRADYQFQARSLESEVQRIAHQLVRYAICYISKWRDLLANIYNRIKIRLWSS